MRFQSAIWHQLLVIGIYMTALSHCHSEYNVQKTPMTLLDENDLIPLKRSLAVELGNDLVRKTDNCGAFSAMNLDFAALKNAINTGITTNQSCFTCTSIIRTVKNIVSELSNEAFHIAGHIACKHIRSLDNTECEGLVDTYGNETYYVLRKTNELNISESDICILLLGHHCGKLESENHNWEISVPPLNGNRSLSNAIRRDTSFSALHISDTHYDPNYGVGSLAACKGFLCCQKSGGNVSDPKLAAGLWGDHHYCDLPLRSLKSGLEHIEKEHGNTIDMVFWTGDIPPHSIWKATEDLQLETFRTTSFLVRKHFRNVRVFPTVGNHESVPPNLFVDLTVDEVEPFMRKYMMKTFHLYETLAHEWNLWLPSDTLEHFKRKGYYSVQVKPGLKLISLNTNYCYHLNFWLALDSRDPGDQLNWLVQELTAAEQVGDSVIIIGHTPPSLADCIETWSRQYHRIINRFHQTIAGQFFGHTHHDEFTVNYDSEDRQKPISVAYIGPSFTTYGGVNPAYRIYHFDRNTVVSHETYMMNITEANANNNAEWRFEYRLPEAYSMKSLEPKEWDKLIRRCRKNDALFEVFHEHYFRRSHWEKPCDAECRQIMMCRLQTDCSHDRSACFD